MRAKADADGIYQFTGSMKGLQSTVNKVSSNTILSARQIKDAWKKYLSDTKENATKDLKQVSSTAEKEGKKVKSVFSSLYDDLKKGALWTVGGGLVKSLGSAFKSAISKSFTGVLKSINSSFRFESQTIQFKTLTGSIEEAKKHMQDLKELGDTPPFGLEQFAEASRALMRMTDGVLGYKKSLEMIGDVAAATGYSMGELGQAVGRMYAFIRDGQPLSRAVQQLRNMGVITPEVAQKLQDLQEAGKSNVELWAEVEKQLLRYKGAMAETEKTGEGLIGAIGSRWDNIVRAFGQALSEEAKGGLTQVHEAAKALEESGSVEVWANKTLKTFQQVKEAASAIGSAIGWLYERSGVSDVVALGRGKLEQIAYTTTRAVAGIANGEGIGNALSAANREGKEVLRKRLVKGYYFGKAAENGLLGKSFSQAVEDNRAEAEFQAQEEEAIRAKAKEKRRQAEREKERREAEERERINASLAEAQKKKEEADKLAAAKKLAEEQKKAELKAATEAAKKREALDREAHKKRMDFLRAEIAAANGKTSALSATAANAQNEFDRAFAMYRDPTHAASVIGEEKDYRNDLNRLHKDAARYGGKWRIDELSRLMAAGDSQGVSDTLANWRKSKTFSPEIEAMVRASAAERTKTTAEEELRKIQNNTANLDKKLDELLSMKG